MLFTEVFEPFGKVRCPLQHALITGITGQDGSYLAELLLSKGYEVHGVIRRASSFNTGRIDHIYVDPHIPNARLFLHYGDLSTSSRLIDLIYTIRPEEVYHLGAQSHVMVSFENPEYTGDITALGTTRVLDAIRRSGVTTRFYQASSSEMFGAAPPPQNEQTPFHPRSPYGTAKVYAHWVAINYREAYGMFCSNGVLFNHESPRRGPTFVTRKITRAVAHILAGKQEKLYLGNLEAKRDWGYAPEYVEGMWQMLQKERPDDYVLGTGESHTIREFVTEAFEYAGLDWQKHVSIDDRYKRPAEVSFLLADPKKAERELGWRPKINFRELVRIMVDGDMESLGLTPRGEGSQILREKLGAWHQWNNSVHDNLRAAVGAMLA